MYAVHLRSCSTYSSRSIRIEDLGRFAWSVCQSGAGCSLWQLELCLRMPPNDAHDGP